MPPLTKADPVWMFLDPYWALVDQKKGEFLVRLKKSPQGWEMHTHPGSKGVLLSPSLHASMQEVHLYLNGGGQ